MTQVKLKHLIDKIKTDVRNAKLTPEQLRYVFKMVRNETGLIVPYRQIKLPVHLTPGEIYRFLEVAGEINNTYWLYANFMIQTGLRVEESRHIILDDFKDNNQLLVRKAKFGKQRYVPYTNTLKNTIISKLPHGYKGYIWNNNGKQLSKRTLQRWIEKINEKCEFDKRVHIHSLRHTFACLCLSKGLRLEEIKTLMGHSSIKTTEIYGRLELGDIKQKYLQFMGGV